MEKQLRANTATTAAQPIPAAATSPAARDDHAIRFTRKERDFVYGVAMRYMKDEEQAADVTQDALLLAYRHRDSFQGNSRYTTWLYRIAATTSLMHLRKRRRTPLMVSVDGGADGEEARTEEPQAHDASPEEYSASHEALSQAAEELAEMGERYGKIFSMRFLEGYSEAEIASRLRLNVSTVKTRAYRARAELRRRLAERGAPTGADPDHRLAA